VKPQLLKQLGNSADEQHFLDQLRILLSPYGVVARWKIMVDWIEPIPELCCFIAMETPFQASTASNGLGMILLGDDCLFVSVHLTGRLDGFSGRLHPSPQATHEHTISNGLDSWGNDAAA
jgi:hypothetical protein